MPLYDYKCATCGRKKAIFLKLAELDSIQECPQCSFPMNRLISAPAVLGDYPAYTCPITGKLIEGRRAHLENLKKHDCRVFEPGEVDSFQHRRAQEEAQLDQALEATADEFIYNLPPEKKEQLANEMAAGVTADIVRL
jgi:putative FmdB family regulatory protein